MRIPRVIIVEYDSHWPILFKEEKKRILDVIGHIVLAVEHVGSTAVPGLGAKPIIDMMVGVKGTEDADECILPLKKIGYTSFTPDPNSPDHLYCCGKDPHSIGYHLHLIRYRSPEWDKHLLFRDCLRANPSIAQEYYELKRNLAIKHKTYRGGYTKAKTAFIESVTAKAIQDERLAS